MEKKKNLKRPVSEGIIYPFKCLCGQRNSRTRVKREGKPTVMFKVSSQQINLAILT